VKALEPRGARAWIVSTKYGGLRFNGVSSYYGHSPNVMAEVFCVRADAVWVAAQERKSLQGPLERASNAESREYFQDLYDSIKVVAIELPLRAGPSRNVRALKLAQMEATKTGYWLTEKRMRELTR
jgi:hypothetical protein